MLLFIDTAELSAIEEFAFMLDGITTTPTIIRRSGRSTDEFIAEVRQKHPHLELHVEALADDAQKTIELIEGYTRQDWYDAAKLVFKVPISPEGLKATCMLRRDRPEVKVNLHMAFSAAQASLAMHARPAYVAPLIGRYADRIAELHSYGNRSKESDAGFDMLDQVMECKRGMRSDTIVLASSIRTPHDFVIATLLGADAVTLPPAVLLDSLEHPMTVEGVDIMRRDLG